MSRILFVSRDNGGAKMTVPTALLAIGHGYEVGLVVEGLAADRFQEAGLFGQNAKAKLLFKGPENAAEIPFSLDALAMLKKFAPDVVVVSRSIPESLENLFGIAANDTAIPLVLMEDYWGGYKLYQAKPDMLITLDEYARELAHSFYPNIPIFIAGNPTVTDPSKVEIPTEVKTRVEELRAKFGRVFIFAGGNPHQMTVELQLLIECLKQTKNWCLISRPHPTIAKSDKDPGLKWSDFWNEMLSGLGDRLVSVECKLGDHLAMLCDATISGFSLMLNTAASAGRAAISLKTNIAVQELSKTGDFAEVPIVALGCARTLSEPCDLDEAGLLEPISKENLAKLRPFNPATALSAIGSLI